MRCPDCSKFVSFDTDTEPEVDDLSVDEEGYVTGTVRIVNTCAECGTELTEATLDLEVDLMKDCESHVNEEGETKHSLSVDVEDSERTERSDGKPGTPARYRRHFYGAHVAVSVTCECDESFEATGAWDDDVQGSSMEELT